MAQQPCEVDIKPILQSRKKRIGRIVGFGIYILIPFVISYYVQLLLWFLKLLLNVWDHVWSLICLIDINYLRLGPILQFCCFQDLVYNYDNEYWNPHVTESFMHQDPSGAGSTNNRICTLPAQWSRTGM